VTGWGHDDASETPVTPDEDGRMTITVLLPTTVAMPAAVPDGTRYVPYDPYTTVPEEHLDAEVLGVWGNPDAQLADAARRLHKLRVVQLFSAGSDNALRAGFDPDVVIATGRGLHDRPVAEHTLALVLAAARRLHRAFAAQRDHEWATDIGGLQPEPSPGVFSTLRGARVTVWGFGSIGRTLEPHLTALGAIVTGVARRPRQEGHVTVIDESHLLDRLAETDVLIMILPSTPATRGVLDADKLAALPAHTWVINVGRGDTVDEPALMDALRRGRIAGAALDVTSIEPLPADSPLWDTPNLIITPHAAGGRPLGALDLLAENLNALLAGRPLRNVVET
jgi:phosphoglycerate dehydrogenase-like enzyme